jgi:hypothetical protein
VHHRLRGRENPRIQAIDDLHADAEARLRWRGRPVRQRRTRGGKQRVGIGLRVVDAQRFARVGRHFAGDPAHGARLPELEGAAELLPERQRGGLCRGAATGVAIRRLAEQ